MKAVILAAGMGKRLQTILKGKPKPLFEIGGKSLLLHSLEALWRAGIKEVIVATGFEEDTIKNSIGLIYKDVKILYIRNDKYNKSGSMHSFYLALGKPQSCLVLDGDIIFHPDAIKEILEFNKENAILLSKLFGSGDEVIAALNHGEVISLGKVDISHNPSEGIISINTLSKSNQLFEFTGISKFSQEFVEKMFELHKENINKGEFNEHCEYCACRTGAYIPWHGYVKEDLLWSEIDNPLDVQRAQAVFNAINKSKNDN